jgi:hypothetical protein
MLWHAKGLEVYVELLHWAKDNATQIAWSGVNVSRVEVARPSLPRKPFKDWLVNVG